MSTPNIVVTAKDPKSFVQTVIDGAGNRMQFIAAVNKDGALFWVIRQTPAKVQNRKGIEVDGFKTTGRGASEQHPSLAAASDRVREGVAIALKAGWSKPAGPRGFERKPDAFTLSNLPKPVKK